MSKYADSFSLICVAEEAMHVCPAVACLTKMAMGHLGPYPVQSKSPLRQGFWDQTHTMQATVVQLAVVPST
jgi:hypothetical protein